MRRKFEFILPVVVLLLFGWVYVHGQGQNFSPALTGSANTFSATNTFTQQIVESVATGTAPFSVASTTNVANLNASSLNGATMAAPGAIGGTTPAAITGTTIKGTLYASTTNCAAVGTSANPSVSACSAAPAGSVSCAVTQTSCQVNTTAVTANSQIFISQREDTVTGTRLSVTCNTSPSVVVASENITTVVAATSFTFAQTAPVGGTNPNCWSYYIIN
jgi:hypothetical protein